MSSVYNLRYCVGIVVILIAKATGLYAQEGVETNLVLDTTHVTVSQLLQQLQDANRFRVAYSEDYLDVERTVRMRSRTPTVQEVLATISQVTNMTYQVRSNQIVFRRKGAKVTLSGYVRDAASGEDLIGANVWDAATAAGTSSNAYGFYSFTRSAGDTVRIKASYVGYAPKEMTLVLTQDTVMDISLNNEVALDEVIVLASGSSPSPTNCFDLPVSLADLQSVPALLGEVDILKGLQRLPGVQAGTDGSAGLYVRGSSADHNLLLLDGVPVYNAAHLFGFFSVFNADAVNNVSFYKGGFPARYGGRLASVVDIQLKEGHREKFQGTGSVGLLSSRLTLEGPLLSPNTSFLLSGRYGHPGPVTRAIKALGGADAFLYGFYDLTAKVNHVFSHRDQVYLSTYLGRDRLANKYEYSRYDNSTNEDIRDTAEENLRWGNLTTALRWNHVYSRRLFSNLTLTYSRYRFRLDEADARTVQRTTQLLMRSYLQKQRRSEIYDQAVKIDFDYLPRLHHHVRFGASVVQHAFQPNTIQLGYREDERSAIDTTYGADLQYGVEGDIYLEDEVQLAPSLTANLGFRATGFWVNGATYVRGQPRISLQYQPTPATAGWISYTRMAQFMHLLANPSINLPTDQWLPTTRRLPPETAQQWTAGYRRTIRDRYAFQVEGYYKRMRNIVEYKEGGFELFEEVLNWEDNVVSGQGRSYGLELLVQRTTGRLTGWWGYTLGRSERRFAEIDEGAWFPFKYDRRHDVDFGGVFHWKDRIDVSWGWGFSSGFAITLPTVAFNEVVPEFGSFNGRQRVVFGSRNGQRTRAAHRLDVSISFHKETRWGERTWEFGLYNAYSRRNPLTVSYYRGYSDRPTFRFYQISLLPILPMVSYRFTF